MKVCPAVGPWAKTASLPSTVGRHNRLTVRGRFAVLLWRLQNWFSGSADEVEISV